MKKVSIITVSKNSDRTIRRTIASVKNQNYLNIEHIVKDGLSTDLTVEVAISENKKLIIKSSKDSGVYDAMNQGFFASTGEIIGFLNSDDFYCDNNVISEIVDIFDTCDCDIVYGDISMINSNGKIIRNWITGDIGDKLNRRQIPHPAMFVRRRALNMLNKPFDFTYKISADLKQQLQLINHFHLSAKYLPRKVAVMQLGGISTNSLSSYIMGWRESYRAYLEVLGPAGALTFVIGKVISKVAGFIK